MWQYEDAKLIRYVSDLHIGNGSRKDDFKKEVEFISFLDDTIDRGGVLAILGDMVDIEQTSIFDIIDKYHILFDRLTTMYNDGSLLILNGNHDFDLRILNILGISIPVIYAYNDTLLLHGHQFDSLCKKDTWWQRKLIKACGYAEYIYPKIDSRNPDMLQRRNPDVYHRSAAEYAADNNVSTIVMGHTHSIGITYHNLSTPRIVRFNNITVCDCGSWCNSHMNYIEYCNGIWQACNWNKYGGISNG